MTSQPQQNLPPELWQRLRDQHRRRLLLPFSVATIIFGAVSVITVLVARRTEIAAQLSTYLALLGGGLSLAYLVGLLLHRWRSESLRNTAYRLDETAAASARLEAAVQLAENPNPLREAQHADTQRYYASRRKTVWSLILVLIQLLAFAILTGDALVIHHYWSRTPPPPPAPPEEAPEFAELILTAPESEIRAKALDDIAWVGTGHSTHPFDSLSIEVAVNGIQCKALPVKAPATRGTNGTIRIDGSLLMDEFAVVPFDVVSYHLHGTLRVKNHPNRDVFSTPQFIEIRPLREDAQLDPSGGDSADPELQKLANVTGKMLKFQILLNRALFEARSCGLGWNNDSFRAELKSLATQQQELQVGLDKLLATTPPEKLTPTMLESLRKASDQMKAAIAQLQPPSDIAPPLSDKKEHP